MTLNLGQSLAIALSFVVKILNWSVRVWRIQRRPKIDLFIYLFFFCMKQNMTRTSNSFENMKVQLKSLKRSGRTSN